MEGGRERGRRGQKVEVKDGKGGGVGGLECKRVHDGGEGQGG
jgi:hypothetical protein